MKMITINEKTYTLKLTSRNAVALEQHLGKNPLMLFQENEMPSLGEMILVFSYSLKKFHKDLTIDDAYDIYDEYIEDGNDYVKFIMLITEIFKSSGFIPKDAEIELEEKN